MVLRSNIFDQIKALKQFDLPCKELSLQINPLSFTQTSLFNLFFNYVHFLYVWNHHKNNQEYLPLNTVKWNEREMLAA